MPSSLQTLPLIQVFDYLIGPDNKPAAGKQIFIRLSVSDANSTAPVAQLAAETVYPAVTDANGYWTVSVEPNTKINPANTLYDYIDPYKSFQISVSDVGVPVGGWQATSIRVGSAATLSPAGQTVATLTVTNAATFTNGPLSFPAGSIAAAALAAIPESGVTNLVGDLAAKAADSAVVHFAGAETIPGVKTFTNPQFFTSVAFAGTPWRDVTHPTYGAKLDNVTDDSAAINAAIAAVPASGGVVFIPAGTAFIASTIVMTKDNVVLMGAGKRATTLRYTGVGAAVTPNLAGGASVRNYAHIMGMTVDVTGAGAGARALELDNVQRGVFRDLLLNANSNANANNILNLIGSATKSTYFNTFEDVDVTSGATSGACINVGDGCNGNRWFGGVLDGGGQAINCQPTTTTSDTNKFISVAIQTSNASVATLGNAAGGNASDWAFLDLRCEPTIAANFTFTTGKAARNLVLGGTFANTNFVSATNDTNVIARINGGTWSTSAAFNSTGGGAGVSFDDRVTGATHGWLEYSNTGVMQFYSLFVSASRATLDESGNLSTVSHVYPGTPAGATQAVAGLLAGTGVPSNANGNNGDVYFNGAGAAGTTIYQKRAGAWVGIV